jgi:hypothetical protein
MKIKKGIEKMEKLNRNSVTSILMTISSAMAT